MMDNNNELGLKISAESVSEHLNCPVCMNRLSATHMTPCGHRYCEKCIVEWINLRHRCPCCNSPVEKTQLIKDTQFDNLIETICKEESTAETIYFDTLISAAAQNAFTQNSPDNNTIQSTSNIRALFSPIEQVLKEHLRRSLVSHEKLYQDLQKEHRRRVNELDTNVKMSLSQLDECSQSTQDVARQRSTVMADCENRKEALKAELERCSKLVAQAYDRYLTEHIPELSVLPVTVSVSLLNKVLQLSDVCLKPHDSLDDLEKLICAQMKSTGDKVVSFGDDVKFLCFSPFAKRSLYEMRCIASDIVEKGVASEDVVVLPRECRPVIQFGIRPGSEITVYGTVRCESDVPKQCFSTTFHADQSQPMDYFACKNCSVKWICRPCMDICHKDHDVAPYIMNHHPTWACCYCPKKTKCQIQNLPG